MSTNALAAVTVIVPARDEAGAITEVVRGLREAGAGRVIVVDNGSRDATALHAQEAGAEVVRATRPGYGWSCAAGVRAAGDAALVGFIDGDGSFRADDLARLAAVAVRGEADLVLGARREVVALGRHQQFGNALVLAVLRTLYGPCLADTAPLRVIRGDLLRALEMRGSRYAWLIEMLAKAARRKARVAVLTVGYGERRGGRSKVSGSLRGSLLAGLDFTRALIEFRRW